MVLISANRRSCFLAWCQFQASLDADSYALFFIFFPICFNFIVASILILSCINFTFFSYLNRITSLYNILLLIRYPIYHIPNRENVKDLSACFLTYHTLSSSFQGMLLFTTIFQFRNNL